MTQQTAGRFAIRGNIAQQLDAIRIRRFGGIELLIRTLYAVQNRTQFDVPRERSTAVRMQVANRGADLVVGVPGRRLPLENRSIGSPVEESEEAEGLRH